MTTNPLATLASMQVTAGTPDPIDTTTPRTVSLQEAAKVARAVFHEMEAKENEARQREADSYIDPDLRDALERIAALEQRSARQDAQIAELTARIVELTGDHK